MEQRFLNFSKQRAIIVARLDLGRSLSSGKSVARYNASCIIIEGAQVAERLLDLVPIINEGSTNAAVGGGGRGFKVAWRISAGGD